MARRLTDEGKLKRRLLKEKGLKEEARRREAIARGDLKDAAKHEQRAKMYDDSRDELEP